MAHTYRRLSDEVSRFGPIEISERGTWRPLYVVLESGDEEYSGCSLILRALGWTVRVRLPAIIKPYREKVVAQYWDAATIERMGRDWYWEIHQRELGFGYSDGHLSVYLGRQTGDSSTERRWSAFLPWTQWHFHRFSYYGLEGEHLRSWIEPRSRKKGEPWTSRFEEQRDFKASMPKVVFAFTDFDGQAIEATTLIEEREWTFGERAFQWLRFFRRNMVRRCLDLEFSKEVGPEKGSWKGGTVGHSIEMLPGELHEAAFRRYCELEHRSKYRPYGITFVGRVAK